MFLSVMFHHQIGLALSLQPVLVKGDHNVEAWVRINFIPHHYNYSISLVGIIFGLDWVKM